MLPALFLVMLLLPVSSQAANLSIQESIMHTQANTVLSYVIRNYGLNHVQAVQIQVVCRPASGYGEILFTTYASPSRIAGGSTGGAMIYAPLGLCESTSDRKIIYFEGDIPTRPPGAPDPFAAGVKTESF